MSLLRLLIADYFYGKRSFKNWYTVIVHQPPCIGLKIQLLVELFALVPSKSHMSWKVRAGEDGCLPGPLPHQGVLAAHHPVTVATGGHSLIGHAAIWASGVRSISCTRYHETTYSKCRLCWDRSNALDHNHRCLNLIFPCHCSVHPSPILRPNSNVHLQQ